MRKYGRTPQSLSFLLNVCSFVWILSGLPGAQAQETDIFQHPNSEQAGIKKGAVIAKKSLNGFSPRILIGVTTAYAFLR